MGDKVTWNNGGGVHNVKFNDGSFEQPPEPSTSQWTVERTFDTPGVFRYQCGFHGAAMAGVVRVRDATGQVPSRSTAARPHGEHRATSSGLGRLVKQRRARSHAVRERLRRHAEALLAPRTAERFGFARRRKTIGTESDVAAREPAGPHRRRAHRRRRTGSPTRSAPFKVRLDVRATKDTRETARETIKIKP